MERIIKISLLIAVIAATSSVAVAGTVSVTKQTHSLEGLSGVTADQTSNSINYTLAAAYSAGDKITFTFTGNALVATTFPSQLSAPAVDSASPANAIAGLGLGFLNSDSDSVTYRVTSLNQPDDTPGAGGNAYSNRTTVGAQVTLGSIGYKAAAVLAADVTVTVSSQTSDGDILDSAGTLAATIAEAKTQFGTAVVTPQFDNVIEVNSGRLAFTTGSSDTLTWSVTTPDTTGWQNLANVSSSVVTLLGEAGKMTGLNHGDFSSAVGALLFVQVEAKLTVSLVGQVNSGTITFTPPTGGAAVVLEAQGFTLDLVHNYTTASGVNSFKAIATGLAGGWELNAATGIISYMPYATSISQIMYVTNIGTQNGDITVAAVDEQGVLYDLGVIGIANAGKVTKVSKLIEDKLVVAGFGSGKVAMKITVNAPAADISIYASYIIGSGDRGYVEVEYIN
ncbi:MAG: hypothetical protein ACI8YB_002305 [Patiriisocius sp.]|jgi:hypothetical protein